LISRATAALRQSAVTFCRPGVVIPGSCALRQSVAKVRAERGEKRAMASIPPSRRFIKVLGDNSCAGTAS
jgi:hypothetical protein